MKIVKRGFGYGGSNISKENMPKVTAADVISRCNAEIFLHTERRDFMTKDKRSEMLTFDTGRIIFSVNKADITHMIAEDHTENNPWKDQPVENVIRECSAKTSENDNICASILYDLLHDAGITITICNLKPSRVYEDPVQDFPEIMR